MKKLLILFALLALLLTGCNTAEKGMYLKKVELTKAEEGIAKLLGAANGSELIYDFKVDENVRSISVNSYELIDGKWELISGGGGYAMNEKTGRIALRFENLGAGMRVAMQLGDDFTATEHKTQLPDDNMSRASAMMTDQTQVIYGEEIPLVMQISTDKNEVRSFLPEEFHDPGRIAEFGYEHVYAVTVMFSTEGLE